MRHIISILLENESGALSRVSGLFSARGYNIESLTVAPTEDASLSRMTIVTSGSGDVIEQITKQLNKLVEVVKVVDLFEAPHIERELMLIKVRATRRLKETIVAAVTAEASQEQMAKARAAGFDGFLGKPLDPDRFPDQIRRLLRGEPVWEMM